MPRPDNAIIALGRALAKVGEYETPVTFTPASRRFFETLGRTSRPPMAGYFADVVSADPARVRRGDREISKDPLLHSLLHTTLAPVLMNAGSAAT